MKTYRHHITVFEHECIKLGQVINGCVFDEPKLIAFQKYYGDRGVPFFSLIHRGIQFNEHVGVIQVGDLLIEVLPKADNKRETADWRKMLIGMMRAVGSFDIRVSSSSHLKLKSNTILDLYIEMFVNEVEFLLHSGLLKKYRKNESNVTALKGNIIFSKHIQHNLTHQERFYVRHTTYDVEHTLHQILHVTIRFLRQINTNATLQSRIGALQLFFPEMPPLKVTEATFEKLVYNPKSEAYRKSIEIARLLLLQYHPDVSKGKNHVLALMFDMNKLWEQYVYVSLRKYADNYSITPQSRKNFWQPDIGYKTNIIPDIVINKDTDRCVVLDTKWKNLNGYNPSSSDLQQMFVYHHYFNAVKTALIYPGTGDAIKGTYFGDDEKINKQMQCYVIPIDIQTGNVRAWQKKIADDIKGWLSGV